MAENHINKIAQRRAGPAHHTRKVTGVLSTRRIAGSPGPQRLQQHTHPHWISRTVSHPTTRQPAYKYNGPGTDSIPTFSEHHDY
jgi:hypothetical protein